MRECIGSEDGRKRGQDWESGGEDIYCMVVDTLIHYIQLQ